MMEATTGDGRAAPEDGGGGREAIYKTKTVEFLGRPTPVILQNDNGPCPLLAICNALLLRNSLNLAPDTPEVPLHRLLSLVTEKLIDSNINVQDKDDEYVSNQQQNIADAIDLLPCLATGIDVNVQFRKINDFEFTRECAIFDLLDIGLYHGWIVDPQDTDTVAAIGSKSYNALAAELVAFETEKPEGKEENVVEEDYVDFAAATAAVLGVPSPNLSRGRSFDECPIALTAGPLQGKGDREEVELMRDLNLSKAETSHFGNVSVSSGTGCGSSQSISWEIIGTRNFDPETHAEHVLSQFGDESGRSHHSGFFESRGCNAFGDCNNDALFSKISSESNTISTCVTSDNDIIQSVIKEPVGPLISSDPVENIRADMLILNQVMTCQSPVGDGPDGFDGYNTYNYHSVSAGEDRSTKIQCTEDLSTSQNHPKTTDELRREFPDISKVVTSGLEGSEPLYEGEDCILDSRHLVYEDQEPMYEGELVLAEQAERTESVNSEHGAHQQWQSVKSFLENSASQLTIYGLFCLQEGLKERELCVFFRNNHFSTMFKFNGELYLLATDQGYIDQPDLVWEKLNEVNGDTVFMTGNFMEYKVENPTSGSWNEKNAMTTTADYLAKLEDSSTSSSAMNSDLQLAIALQQQEFEQQPQQHKEQSQEQSFVSSHSRLVTGPQIHTKKRNRLHVQKLNSLVYVQFNAKLKNRRLQGIKDPIASKDKRFATEWYENVSNPQVEEDDQITSGLNWEIVGEAMGVDEVLEQRRSQRTQTHASTSQPIQEEEALFESDDETEEDEGFLDPVDYDDDSGDDSEE